MMVLESARPNPVPLALVVKKGSKIRLSARVGNASNRLLAPPRETLDIGLRYRFSIGRVQSLLRAQLANVFNDYGWQVSPNGAFQYSTSRRVLAELNFEI